MTKNEIHYNGFKEGFDTALDYLIDDAKQGDFVLPRTETEFIEYITDYKADNSR